MSGFSGAVLWQFRPIYFSDLTSIKFYDHAVVCYNIYNLRFKLFMYSVVAHIGMQCLSSKDSESCYYQWYVTGAASVVADENISQALRYQRQGNNKEAIKQYEAVSSDNTV